MANKKQGSSSGIQDTVTDSGCFETTTSSGKRKPDNSKESASFMIRGGDWLQQVP
jgi:hypothetical protein